VSENYLTRQQRHAWFVRQPARTAIGIAARCALRHFPFAAANITPPTFEPDSTELTPEEREEAYSAKVLFGVRALVLGWGFVKYPDREIELRGGAVSARKFLRRFPGAADVIQAVTLSGKGPQYAADVAVSAAMTHSDDLHSAYAADVSAIDNGLGVLQLLDRPLWSRSIPARANSYWYELKSRLQEADSNWNTWINWYEARLAGKPTDDFLELASAMIPHETWKEGSKAVNAHINGLLEQADPTNWAARLISLKQASLGVRFLRGAESLQLDLSGDDDDRRAANDLLTKQLHEGVKRRAKEFSSIALRVDNQLGWTGLASAAGRFCSAIDRDTADVPDVIGIAYDSIVSLGSFLELDARLRQSGAREATSPLDLDVQRAFADLIRGAAPWIRRFPTARMLDDETGAFLSRTELYAPTQGVIEKAAAVQVISQHDAQLLNAIIDAAKRGEFQGQKAGTRAIWSSKNLVTALAMILSFEAGLINNKAAEQSIIAQRGAQFYLRAEDEVLKLFEDSPADIRRALIAMIEDLRSNSERLPGDLPPSARDYPVDRVRKTDDEELPSKRPTS
jgi:hypothetical protein